MDVMQGNVCSKALCACVIVETTREDLCELEEGSMEMFQWTPAPCLQKKLNMH